MKMHLVKAFAIGAGMVWASNQIANSSFVQGNPQLAQYAPYLAGGVTLLAFKHFNLV
jgi:hypothetical protein